jgi:hypothetical protein
MVNAILYTNRRYHTHTHTHNSCCWSPTPGSVLNKSSRAVDQANSSGFLSLSVGIISFVLIAPSFPPSSHQNLASWSPGCRPPLPGSMRNQYQRLGINHGGPLLSTAQHSPRAGNNNRNVYSYRDDDSVVTSSRCVGREQTNIIFLGGWRHSKLSKKPNWVEREGRTPERKKSHSLVYGNQKYKRGRYVSYEEEAIMPSIALCIPG